MCSPWEGTGESVTRREECWQGFEELPRLQASLSKKNPSMLVFRDENNPLPSGRVQLMIALPSMAENRWLQGNHKDLDWRGLAWLIEMRGLSNGSKGVASRSEGLGDRLAGSLSIKVRVCGPGWPGPCQ